MLLCTIIIVFMTVIISVPSLYIYSYFYKYSAVNTDLTDEYLKTHGQEYDRATGIAAVILTFIAFPASGLLIGALKDRIYFLFFDHIFCDTLYSTYPNIIYWIGIHGLLLGLTVMGPCFMLLTYLRFGMAGCANYLCYIYLAFLERRRNLKTYRFNNYNLKERMTKELKGNMTVFIISTLIICFADIAFVNMTCVFEKDKIQIGITGTYSPEDIAEIYHAEKFRAPAGNIVDVPYYVVVFKDGRMWNDRNKHAGFDKAAKYLNENYGVEILETEYYPELR